MGLSDAAGVEFSDYGDILRRRWWLILACVVAGLGIAVAAVHYLPKTYSSEALVQVKPTGEDGAVANGRTSSELNLDTEAQLVTSNDVALRAKAVLRTNTSPRDLAKNVSVTVPPNTSVLSIAYDAGTPQVARAGAQAFADSYLTNRKEAVQNDLDFQAKSIRDQIKDLQSQLTKSNKEIAAAAPRSAERADAQATSTALSSQIHDLSAQLAPLLSQNINPGNVITAAQVPQVASAPSTKLIFVSGFLAGLLAGCLLAFAADRLDRRIRDRRDLERLGLDAMANNVAVPAVQDGGTSLATGEGAESLRQLRNALLAQMPHREGAVIVTNASDPNAGSAVAVSLAVTIARSGADVILLSANTVQCAIEQAFDVPVQPGLVDVLRARADLEDAVFDVREIPHLKVIPAGSDGSLSSDLLQGPRVEAAIKKVAASAEVVVVDVAPPSLNADAQTLVTASDGVLLVATARKTKRPDVLGAVDQFRHVSARVFGGVVVTVNRERHTGGAPKHREPKSVVHADAIPRPSAPTQDIPLAAATPDRVQA